MSYFAFFNPSGKLECTFGKGVMFHNFSLVSDSD